MEADDPTTRADLGSLTRTALLVRLLSVALVAAPVAAGQVAHDRSVVLPVVAVALVLAVSSYVLLTRPRLLALVERHPSIALADVLLAGTILLTQGAASIAVLGTMTTALLIGLWVPRRSGLVIMVALLTLYLATLGMTSGASAVAVVLVVAVPFMYLILWALGMSVRGSSDAQAAARRDALSAMAASSRAEERRRVSREMHDSLAKSLQGISLATRAVEARAAGDERLAKLARQLAGMADGAVDDARRLMGEYRDESASSARFADEVTSLVTDWRARTGLPCTVTMPENIDVDCPTTRHEVISCLGEALENVARHAGPCTVTVDLHHRGGDLVVTVADTGAGMAPERPKRARTGGRYGLVGLRERMESVGGEFVLSTAPGEGTSARFVVDPSGARRASSRVEESTA